MSYDNWKATAPEGDDPYPHECPVCTGHEDALPCSEECADLIERCRRERLIETCRMAAKLVIKVAKSYQREGFPNDHRVSACIDRVNYYRGRIRDLRRAA
jgi:predicted nucleic acid-binding Zn ribbon protein